MTMQGWEKLLADVPRYGKADRYRIMAYSEMMPSPWIGWRPYGKDHPAPRNPEDPFAWLVNERAQAGHDLDCLAHRGFCLGNRQPHRSGLPPPGSTGRFIGFPPVQR